MAIFSLQMVAGQEVNTVSDNLIYDIQGLDVKPDFPGGRDEFFKFIAKNYKIARVEQVETSNASKKRLQGTTKELVGRV